MGRLPSLAAFLLVLVTGSSAAAQGFDGQRYVPAAGAAGGLQVERPVVPGHLGWSLGLSLDFSDDAVVGRDRLSREETVKPLDHSLAADLLASIGLFGGTELAIHLPVRLMAAGQPATVPGGTVEASSGVGDLRLVPKVALGGGELRTALALPITIATGSPAALRGSIGAVVEPRLLMFAYGDRWLGGGSVGFRYRAQESAWARHEVTYAVASAFSPTANAVYRLLLEAAGAWIPGVDPRAGSALPLEVVAAVAAGDRWSVHLGGGVGLTNGVGVPDFRVLAGIRHTTGLAPPSPQRSPAAEPEPRRPEPVRQDRTPPRADGSTEKPVPKPAPRPAPRKSRKRR